MPIKFKQSTNTRDRATGKNKIEHFYIKQVPKEELIKYINEGQKSSKEKVNATRTLHQYFWRIFRGNN